MVPYSSASKTFSNPSAALPHPIYSWDVSGPEPDDFLHAPDPPKTGRLLRSSGGLSRNYRGGLGQPFVLCSLRGLANVTTLFLVLVVILGLFLAYPVAIHFHDLHGPRGSEFNLGGINGTGQVPELPGFKALIDKATPTDAYERTGSDGRTWSLVFSDEFEVDGRSFYPGDDAYWEAQDFHYWATGDLEWYDPSAVTTADGKLVITLSKTENHGLDYMSGMLTGWNKFCFSSGYIEVSLSLPGSGSVAGLWPGVWMLGNLGRAGFGATTDGTWPYSYDTCDIGSFPRQMDHDGNPDSSTTDGWQGSYLSDLNGQRLSACTCPNSDHPGPNTGVGRGVPELDVLEAQVDLARAARNAPFGEGGGEVSQSFQVAPFNAHVQFLNSTPETIIVDPDITHFNSFTGTALQQSVSAVTQVSNNLYNGSGYSTYGVEFYSSPKTRDSSYINWYAHGKKSWGITAASLGADPVSEVSARLIPEEPMYLVINLGMSPSFEAQDFDHLVFPSRMYIDYVRVYQREDIIDSGENIGCDPSQYPTAKYINS